MKKWIVVTCLLLCRLGIYAQFEPRIAHYMFLHSVYNPAAAGEGELMKVSALHRMQLGFTNGVQTTYFHFQSPFEIGSTRHGAAIRLLNDRAGLFTNQSLHLQYAYKYKLGDGYLSGGVEAGFLNIGFRGDSVQEVNSDYHDIKGDKVIPVGAVSGMGVDMGLGIHYEAANWRAGVSYIHLNRPTIRWGDYSTHKMASQLFLSGGYSWKITDSNYALHPSALIQTDFVGWDWNLALQLEYKERFRGGVALREPSIGVMVGMDVITGLAVGYAYEIPTTKLIQASSGSHELCVTYSFNIIKPTRNSKYKSIRIL